MSRWIDADALVDKLLNAIECGKRVDMPTSELEAVLNDVKTTSSIDIVRCKECKYAHMTYGGECKYCDKWSLEDSLYLDGDFFCSYGERSDE